MINIYLILIVIVLTYYVDAVFLYCIIAHKNTHSYDITNTCSNAPFVAFELQVMKITALLASSLAQQTHRRPHPLQSPFLAQVAARASYAVLQWTEQPFSFAQSASLCPPNSECLCRAGMLCSWHRMYICRSCSIHMPVCQVTWHNTCRSHDTTHAGHMTQQCRSHVTRHMQVTWHNTHAGHMAHNTCRSHDTSILNRMQHFA